MNKKWLLALVMGILLLTAQGCLKLDTEKWTLDESEKNLYAPLTFGSVNNFAEGFAEIQRIERKFEIDFKQEQLYKTMVREETIDLAIAEFKRLRKYIVDSNNLAVAEFTAEKILEVPEPDRTELQLILFFIDARVHMLKAQLNLHKGYKHGMRGLVGDGFFCLEKPFILDSLESFNESVAHAQKAHLYLDELLTATKEITWEHVGVRENKTAFYNSLIGETAKQVKVDNMVFWRNCKDEPADSKVYISMERVKDKNVFIVPEKFFADRTTLARAVREPEGHKDW